MRGDWLIVTLGVVECDFGGIFECTIWIECTLVQIGHDVLQSGTVGQVWVFAWPGTNKV
jgi:hypothetical protein